MKSLLKTEQLSKHFGGLKAVDEVDLEIEGEGIFGIIGPNGAGKTTFFNLVTGYLNPTKGKIFYRGDRIDGLKPHVIAKTGVARTFQIVRPFSNLTVLENVLMGHGSRYYDRTSALYSKYGREKSKAEETLEFVDLEKWSSSNANTLPIGLQRRLEIARVLALKPKLILLDEPAAGLTEEEMTSLKELLLNISKREVTILLVEHTMSFVMGICEKIFVLDRGRCIARGTPEQIQQNEKVIDAYLGTDTQQEDGFNA